MTEIQSNTRTELIVDLEICHLKNKVSKRPTDAADAAGGNQPQREDVRKLRRDGREDKPS